MLWAAVERGWVGLWGERDNPVDIKLLSLFFFLSPDARSNSFFYFPPFWAFHCELPLPSPHFHSDNNNFSCFFSCCSPYLYSIMLLTSLTPSYLSSFLFVELQAAISSHDGYIFPFSFFIYNFFLFLVRFFEGDGRWWGVDEEFYGNLFFQRFQNIFFLILNHNHERRSA